MLFRSRRQELWLSAADRLRSLAGRAIDVLEASLGSESELSFRSAVQILKCLGFADGIPAPTGPTEVEDAEIAQRRRDYERMLAGLAAGS